MALCPRALQAENPALQGEGSDPREVRQPAWGHTTNGARAAVPAFCWVPLLSLPACWGIEPALCSSQALAYAVSTAHALSIPLCTWQSPLHFLIFSSSAISLQISDLPQPAPAVGAPCHLSLPFLHLFHLCHFFSRLQFYDEVCMLPTTLWTPSVNSLSPGCTQRTLYRTWHLVGTQEAKWTHLGGMLQNQFAVPLAYISMALAMGQAQF